jgi:hypothetical protein
MTINLISLLSLAFSFCSRLKMATSSLQLFRLNCGIYFLSSCIWPVLVTCFDQWDVIQVALWEVWSLGVKRSQPPCKEVSLVCWRMRGGGELRVRPSWTFQAADPLPEGSQMSESRQIQQKSHPATLKPWAIINLGCFKLLSFGVVCYVWWVTEVSSIHQGGLWQAV